MPLDNLILEVPDEFVAHLKKLVDDRTRVTTTVGRDAMTFRAEERDTQNVLCIRRSPTPLSEAGDAVYIQDVDDILPLMRLRSDSGIARLFAIVDVDALLDSYKSRLHQIFAAVEKKKKIYIFGAHLNGAKCSRLCDTIGIKVAGFIDNDSRKHRTKFCGKDVAPLSAITNLNAVIVNSSGRYCVDIDKQLHQSGFHNRLHFMEFLFCYDLQFQGETHFRNFITDIIQNRNKYLTLYLSLSDEKSRSILDDLLNYRITLDPFFARRARDPYDEEFFSKDLLKYGNAEVFVDGGAYDGDSFRRFMANCPSFRRAYLYEPDQKIFNEARQAFAHDRRVQVNNYGLFSNSADLYFASTGGMDGAISDDGDVRIKVVSVDEHIDDDFTFLKLDVEGAETAALRGAKNHIVRSSPMLSIAAYHRAHDLWAVPMLIASFGVKYKYYFRHYSETMDDTVLYALPLNRTSL